MRHIKTSRNSFLFTASLVAALVLLAYGVEHDPESTEPAETDYLEQIVLRSVVSLPGERIFSLYDPVNDRSFWIQAGETRYAIEAVDFDDDANILTVRYAGHVRQLGLTSARVGTGQRETPGEGRETDARAARQSEREQRLAEQERRYEERDLWRELRERIRHEAETSTEIAEISESFTQYREEMRTLHAALQETDRDSPEFEALRAQVSALNESFEEFRDAAGHTLAEHPSFDEADVERMMSRGLEAGPRGNGGGRTSGGP